jgi:Flp pilus assembly protein TadD
MKTIARTLILVVGLTACRDEPLPVMDNPPSRPPTAGPVPLGASAAALVKESSEVHVTSSSREAIELFRKGRDDADNTREAEALEHLHKAIALDPKFALALAYAGYYEPGVEGEKSLKQALALSKDLPEPERLTIEELSALRSGDNEKARELARRITVISPFDWHAQLDLGNRFVTERKFAEAEQAFGKAAAFGPPASVTYNALGYLYLVQRKFELAITEFKKYASLRPDEPNTLDSLGEALMAVGKLDEAEQSFKKAAEMKFSFAWGGVAQTRFLRGDWGGGMEALGRSRESAVLPSDQLDVDGLAIWAVLAQGRADDALKRADALEKEAKDRKVDEQVALAAVYRAVALADTGKQKDALAELGKAAQWTDKAVLSGLARVRVRRMTLTWRALVEATLGKGPDAEKTAALMDEEAKKTPGQADYQSMATFGKGAVALAKGDVKGAAAKFAECPPDDVLCRWQLSLAQDKLGAKKEAEATRGELLKANLRDPMYVYVRSKLGGTK